MSYFKHAEGRETKDLAPGARTRTFWGDNMLLSLVEIDANSLVPLHTHPHEQGGIIVEGEMEMGIAGEVKLLKPGRHVHHPRRRGTLRQGPRPALQGPGRLQPGAGRVQVLTAVPPGWIWGTSGKG